jgi:hypothetical protein
MASPASLVISSRSRGDSLAPSEEQHRRGAQPDGCSIHADSAASTRTGQPQPGCNFAGKMRVALTYLDLRIYSFCVICCES